LPLIYVTRSETDDDFEVTRREWYRRRHSTDIIGVGFWSARGFRATAVPRNWSIYEIPKISVLSSDAYMEMRRNDTFSPTVMKSFSYMSASVYTQVWVGQPGGRITGLIPTLAGTGISAAKFDADDPDAVRKWFEREVFETYRTVPGVSTVRLWEQRSAHPLFPPKEPRWCVAIEWALASQADEGILSRALDAAPGARSASFNSAEKWYGLLREDVFAAPSPEDLVGGSGHAKLGS
jgi:hypothetical protein